MGLLVAMTILSKIKAPEATDLYRKTCEKCQNSFFFLHLLHQDNFIAYLLCHVTYILLIRV